tara:strand:+ start:1539 stop:1715 length:177 start_codon:yes stop_codon:yes gene_type:complete
VETHYTLRKTEEDYGFVEEQHKTYLKKVEGMVGTERECIAYLMNQLCETTFETAFTHE